MCSSDLFPSHDREDYPKYGYPFHLASNGKDLTCLVAKKGFISVYDKAEHKFIDVSFRDVDPVMVINAFFDRTDYLWIISKNGQIRRLKVTIKQSGKSLLPLIEPSAITLNTGNLNVAFEDNGLIHLHRSLILIHSLVVE